MSAFEVKTSSTNYGVIEAGSASQAVAKVSKEWGVSTNGLKAYPLPYGTKTEHLGYCMPGEDN